MFEVELKVRAAHDRVRAALREAGAEPRGAVRQADTYYGAPHRAFAETGEALRVRRETALDAGAGDARTLLAYKGPLVDPASKTRAEHETGVADARTVAAILAALGFEPVETVTKERERYVLDGHEVALDRVEGLGEFVEVEARAATMEGGGPGAGTRADPDAPGGASSGLVGSSEAGTDAAGTGEAGPGTAEFETVEAAREAARAVLERLGLDPDDQVRDSYLAMLLD